MPKATTETDAVTPSSARPEHGPSHIEARERLEALAYSAASDGIDILGEVLAVYGDLADTTYPQWQRIVIRALAADLRTLLDTPTQGEDISPSRDHEPAIGSALEALKPFSAYAETLMKMGRGYPKTGVLMALQTGSPDERELTVEDFEAARKAHALLSSAIQVAGRGPGMQNNTSAAPTQDGVGREEIARIIDPDVWNNIPWRKRAGYDDTHNCQRSLKKADAILSLLPAPKLGEGEDHDDEIEDAFKEGVAIGYQCGRDESDPEAPYTLHIDAINEAFAESNALKRIMARFDAAKPQQPAPGAPEGWREALEKALPILHEVAGTDDPEQIGKDAALKDAIVAVTAALTSSSAKPVGDDSELARQMRLANEARLEAHALAQSNRRLREGLERAKEQANNVTFNMLQGPVPLDAIARALQNIADDARAALKDNGHG